MVIDMKKRHLKQKPALSEILMKTFTICLAILILFPFAWLLLTSLKTVDEYYTSPAPLFPSNPQWSRFWTVLVDLEFYTPMLNSIMIAACSVVISLTMNSFIGYGMARFKFKGKNIIFILILVTMFLPAQVTSIPKFILYYKLGWLDTYLPIIIPMFFGSSTGILYISQFIRTVPKEMDEAAMVDGCGHLRIWSQIVIPQIVPALVLSGINAFLSSWKSSMGPLIYLRSPDLYTVPLALLYFQSPESNSNLMLMAGVLISMIPTLIVFIIGQVIMDKGATTADLK